MKATRIVLILFLIMIFALTPACNGGGKNKDTNDAGQKDPIIGKKIEFTIKTLDGQTLTPDNFKGKVLIVDYWFVACSPCRKMFTHFATLREKYGDDINIIGMNTDPGIKEVQNFIDQNPQPFIVGIAKDSDTPLWKEPSVFPTTYFIDRDGFIVYKGQGGHDFEELDKIVAPLIAKAPTAPMEDTVPEAAEPPEETEPAEGAE